MIGETVGCVCMNIFICRMPMLSIFRSSLQITCLFCNFVTYDAESYTSLEIPVYGKRRPPVLIIKLGVDGGTLETKSRNA